ncbi:hypothetical protein NL369_29840, partial [Klebsiella pneumoniae]|nr:hypothetical protein [Klebsiella pneumoniae]
TLEPLLVLAVLVVWLGGRARRVLLRERESMPDPALSSSSSSSLAIEAGRLNDVWPARLLAVGEASTPVGEKPDEPCWM